MTIQVVNRLPEDTSIHWHGLLLPAPMDGVPGVAFTGIAPGETFTYRFPLKQAGTYWYHSHSGLQEQLGHYGPIIIDPVDGDPAACDREHVILLSDWTFEDPHRVFVRLKKMSGAYNYQQRTMGEFFRDVQARGLDAATANRLMWGAMRMNPTDLSDVTGATYTYLVNGHSPSENWTGLFRPGEKVRLRFINASAMSIFNIRIPGLPMTVVQADGQNVQPVETDEFQLGTAETLDVIVEPGGENAYTIMCETNDRSGFAAATLAVRDGLRAPVPALRKRPLLTMKDMGMSGMQMDEMAMDDGSMTEMNGPQTVPEAMAHGNLDHTAMTQGDAHMAMASQAGDHTRMNHGTLNHDEMHHGQMSAEETAKDASMASSMQHAMKGSMKSSMKSATNHEMAGDMKGVMSHGGSAMAMTSEDMQAHDHPRGPGVMNVAMNPVSRLHERPLGLEHETHRVMVYTDLKSLEPNPDQRQPGREIELHLTSNMERHMWSFDGVTFSEMTKPVVFHQDERLRLTLVNDTMMPHPIHLHGMFFEVVTGEQHHKPRKHTIVVKPGEKLSVDITADAPGNWAFHCHLLYHMKAGMMQVVSVREDRA